MRDQLYIAKADQAREQGYIFAHWRDFDYKRLSCIMWERRAGRRDNKKYNNAIIMGDTETSKKDPSGIHENHVVAWTLSVRAHGVNICTLYGHRPDTFAEALERVHRSMEGDCTICYFHNLPYDWVFLRQFLMERFGTPERQLNVKPHYPLFIEFNNGIILKDSLILAQRSLDKWAKDLNVEHQKATGKWDYDKIRTQKEIFSPDELEYIEHDTLAGVECIDKLRIALHKHLYAMPYTATGIPREESRKLGKKAKARNQFERLVGSYEQQKRLELVFHGGYTHGYRHYINRMITDQEDGLVKCYDFASSYPYCMIAERFPMENFHKVKPCTPERILKLQDKYAYIAKCILVKPRLKNDFEPMPALQYSKTVRVVDPVLDNGRILCAGYVEIYLTEQDIAIIYDQYITDGFYCVEVEAAAKDYLPKWFRDYVYRLFEEKTKLKCGDPVLYALAKAKLNSLYGMCVQKPVQDVIEEDYLSGEYSLAGNDPEEGYKKYVDNKNSILPYQWGVWVTAYALRHLYQLGKCAGTWIYSDTDSCYGIDWDLQALELYNEECKRKIRESGYQGVIHNDREYWLGVAEHEGDKDTYTEFKVLGAKRYAGRCKADGEIHITVAGVPKKGAACLENDLNNFNKGFIFSGKKTGKKLHTYFFNDVYTDPEGNITGDSIDLSPCDYLLDDISVPDWEKIFTEEIEIQVYEEG